MKQCDPIFIVKIAVLWYKIFFKGKIKKFSVHERTIGKGYLNSNYSCGCFDWRNY